MKGNNKFSRHCFKCGHINKTGEKKCVCGASLKKKKGSSARRSSRRRNSNRVVVTR